jgi:hypothetical protein
LQDLTLRPFPAIDQETILIVFDDLRGEAALGGRRGGGRTKKKNLEQMESFGDNICHRAFDNRVVDSIILRHSVASHLLLHCYAILPDRLPHASLTARNKSASQTIKEKQTICAILSITA